MSSRRRLLDPAARMRVGRAKSAAAIGALVVFAAAYGLTRSSHPSHTKHPLRQLDAPSDFTQQLQQDAQLQGGIVAAPQAPPEAQTAAS
jgi:hypothetical protein